MTLGALRERIASGDLRASDVAAATLDAMEGVGAPLGAFLHVDREGALAAADRVDRDRAAGRALGPLAGVPVALKDNLCTRGVPTTCASRMLEGYRPPYDAAAVERLRAAGAVLVGKTNMDEFAMGSSTEHSAFGPTRNPWDLGRVPGGSSGGSAAAVAAGLVPVALGSDTGGSVRQPGAFCGVAALKPTYGRVSRYGLVAFASSLDQVGPFGRTVADVARVLAVIAGHDPRDATSSTRAPTDYVAEAGRGVAGLRVGVVRPWLEVPGVDAAVRAAFAAAVEVLRGLGATVVDVTLPYVEHALAVYYLVAPCEASSNLARFDGVRYGRRARADTLAELYARTRAEGFGTEVRRRIMLGTYALSAGYYDAYYLRAQKVRTLLCDGFREAFAACDAVLSPTTPTPAFPLGERAADPLSMYMADLFTLPASLAGLCALSVPCGLAADGLPLGLQIMTPPFEEARALAIGAAYESATQWAARRPGVSV